MMKLTDFCANSDDPRDYLHRPFKVGEWAVATDGIRGIARPLTAEDGDLPDPPEDVAKRIPSVFHLYENDGFLPIPDIDLPPKKQCEKCGGCGSVTVTKCHECYGDGTVNAETQYNTYYDLDCKSCDGLGERRIPGNGEKCLDCGGDGHGWKVYDHVMLCDMYLHPKYVNYLIGKPGLQVKKVGDAPPFKLLFRCCGFSGTIMGMRQ